MRCCWYPATAVLALALLLSMGHGWPSSSPAAPPPSPDRDLLADIETHLIAGRPVDNVAADLERLLRQFRPLLPGRRPAPSLKAFRRPPSRLPFLRSSSMPTGDRRRRPLPFARSLSASLLETPISFLNDVLLNDADPDDERLLRLAAVLLLVVDADVLGQHAAALLPGLFRRAAPHVSASVASLAAIVERLPASVRFDADPGVVLAFYEQVWTRAVRATPYGPEAGGLDRAWRRLLGRTTPAIIDGVLRREPADLGSARTWTALTFDAVLYRVADVDDLAAWFRETGRHLPPGYVAGFLALFIIRQADFGPGALLRALTQRRVAALAAARPAGLAARLLRLADAWLWGQHDDADPPLTVAHIVQWLPSNCIRQLLGLALQDGADQGRLQDVRNGNRATAQPQRAASAAHGELIALLLGRSDLDLGLNLSEAMMANAVAEVAVWHHQKENRSTADPKPVPESVAGRRFVIMRLLGDLERYNGLNQAEITRNRRLFDFTIRSCSQLGLTRRDLQILRLSRFCDGSNVDLFSSRAVMGPVHAGI